MKIIGLTGSIGMGKSLTAAMCRKLGAAVYNADRVVHRLLRQDDATIGAVAARFPEALVDGKIDRARLGRLVFGRPEALRALEAILHPRVRMAEVDFLARAHAQGRAWAVLDIPLLFETGDVERFDHIICVSAPYWLQRRRVLRRAGMTAEKFAAILAQQMPDREKRRRADAVIPTGWGRWVTSCLLRRRLQQWRNEGLASCAK